MSGMELFIAYILRIKFAMPTLHPPAEWICLSDGEHMLATRTASFDLQLLVVSTGLNDDGSVRIMEVLGKSGRCKMLTRNTKLGTSRLGDRRKYQDESLYRSTNLQRA